MDSPVTAPPGQTTVVVASGAPGWVRWAWQYGFAMVFSVVALAYGLYFGNAILQTQRQGIESINRIEIFEQEQVYQLRMVSERLDRIEAKLAAGGGG